MRHTGASLTHTLYRRWHRLRRGGVFLQSCAIAWLLAMPYAEAANLAPDAMTRATTYHAHTGSVTHLVDGIVPPTAGALPFEWNSEGVLVFDWGRVESLARIRLRIGAIANDYGVRTFIDGHLQDEGTTRDPEGELTASVTDVSRVVDDWQVITLPQGTTADNLELHSFGAVQLYEVEILTATGTAISPTPWVQIKKSEPDDLGRR